MPTPTSRSAGAPEVEISTLRALIQGIAQNQDRQDRQFREFQEETKRDIAEIARSVNSMGKLSWPTILSVVTTSIVVGGVLIAFVELRNTDLRERITLNGEAIKEHASADAHPSATATMARLELLTDNNRAYIEAMLEFNRSQLYRNGRVDTLVEDHTTKLESRYSQHDETQNTRLSMLERALAGLDNEHRTHNGDNDQ